MRLLNIVMIYCQYPRALINVMAWYQTEPMQLPKPMATQFTDAYLSLDSDKWNDERWLGTPEYEIAWKRDLHYFDLHLNKRLNKQPPCWLLNALRRRQVTVMAFRITGQSNVCSTVCSDCQQWNIKGPRYCPFVMRIHCDRWFPTQKESNMGNASIWWRYNGLKDTMMAHVSYYAIYTLHYSNYITESESLQPLTKQCLR